MADTTPSYDTPGFLRGQIVQTEKDKLTPPKNIIQTVQGAKSIYYTYRAEHLKRIDQYARIEGLIAGNPPYDPAELARHKLSHIANFNNLEGRANFKRSLLAYSNLLNEVEYIAKFTLRNPITLSASDPDLVEFAEILAANFDKVIRSWPSFYTIINTLSGQIVKFGISPVLWTDERDWRFRTIELARFFVEDQAQSDIEKLTCVCVESIFTAQFLFRVYEEFKDTVADATLPTGRWDYEVCPWNINELTKLLLFKANQFAKTEFQFMDMMDIQRRVQNGDLTFNAIFSDNIRVVSMLYQEYDESITHYMFDRLFDAGEFLFKADRQYKTMQEGIIIFTASPEEFTIHSNKGVGHMIYAACQATNQLDCSIIDMGRMSATPLIKSLSTGTKDFEAIRFYPGVPTNIGTSEFVQNTLGENIQQLVGASQFVTQKMQTNLNSAGDNPGIPDANVGSVAPSQARAESYKEFSVPKNDIQHFYSTFDLVLQNVVSKMLRSKKTYPGYKWAEEWKQKCLDDGVPPEIFSTKDDSFLGLPSHMEVKAARVAGDGSTLAQIMGLQELQIIAPSFDAKAERAYKKHWVRATMGKEYVPQFVSPEEPDESVGGASLAGVENAIMRQGESPIFSPDNEHRAHIAVHLALGNDIIQRIQQQQLTAIEADKQFVVLIPHLTEHMKFIEQNIFARSFLEQVKKPFDELVKYATLNHHNAANEIQANIRKQQEQQAQTQQVLSDQQLKDLQVKSDIQRSDQKVQSQIDRAKEASNTRAEIQRESVRSKADNDRLKVQLEANNKAIEINHKSLNDQKAALQAEPLDNLRQDLSRINGQDLSPYNIETSDTSKPPY